MKAGIGAQAKPVASIRARGRLADFFELTKPKISGMVLVATLAGFYMASSGPLDLVLLMHTLIGTALIGSGASALNQVIERQPDSLMSRTRNRPIPAGRVNSFEASFFGVFLSLAGGLYLALLVNFVAGGLSAASMLLYVLLYTPLKRMTYLNTVIGAIPGALPPMIGWAAAAGSVPLAGWTLFAILFFWQLPHFYAIAWLYREDYVSGGFRMITTDDPLGDRIALRLSGQVLALIAASLTPTLWGIANQYYFFIALVLGLFFMAGAIAMGRSKSKGSARGLLLISVVYLPLILAAMMLCKTRG